MSKRQTGLLRSLRIIPSLFKISILTDMEFRFNISLKVFADVLWYLGQVAVFEVLFYHSPVIGGWDKQQMRVFIFTLFSVDAMYMVLFSENLDQLPTRIAKGDLDMVLLKPINGQLMVSLQKINSAYLLNLTFMFFALAYSLTQISQTVTPFGVMTLVIAMLCGLSMLYSGRLFFGGLSVLFGNAPSIVQVWYQIFRLGTRPDPLYPSWLRYIVLSVIPMAFLASVPARMIIEPFNVWLFLASLVVGAGSLAFSIVYWKFIMKRYSSASS